MQKDKSIYLVVTAFFPSVESFRGPYVYDQVKAIMKDGRYQVVVMMPGLCFQKNDDYDYDGIHVCIVSLNMNYQLMLGREQEIISICIPLTRH